MLLQWLGKGHGSRVGLTPLQAEGQSPVSPAKDSQLAGGVIDSLDPWGITAYQS